MSWDTRYFTSLPAAAQADIIEELLDRLGLEVYERERGYGAGEKFDLREKPKKDGSDGR